MKKLIAKVKAKLSRKKHKKRVEHVHKEISGVRLALRKKFLKLQKLQLKSRIVDELASLKDEVNVEKILADLGEKYILRSDLQDVMLESNNDSDPVLLLLFTKEATGSKEQIERFVP